MQHGATIRPGFPASPRPLPPRAGSPCLATRFRLCQRHLANAVHDTTRAMYGAPRWMPRSGIGNTFLQLMAMFMRVGDAQGD